MTQEAETTIASRPLVFHDQQARVDRDPEVLAARLAQHYALLDFGPRPGFERTFMHRSVTAAAGDLMLTCGYTSPIHGSIGDCSGSGAINFCCSGSAHYQLDGRHLSIDSRQPLFFSPGQAYQYRVDHFNGLAFHVDLHRLTSTASAMAGPGVSSRRFAADLKAARVLGLDGGRQEQLLRLLLRGCQLLGDPGPGDSLDLGQLGVDDLLYRTLALLLCPDLPSLLEHGLSREVNPRERQFQELLDWIHSQLHGQISLTSLEQRSGYSRRSLQTAFQERFGCGPIQWVRQQRLEQARLALLQPQEDDSVSTIARRFGYANLASFSREFSSRYGATPSSLLREGRRRYG